ncbi:MAG: tRNA threonylcarbamoyladenosine biosynthesis protein TsaE [Gaiellales bacterium]|nr:tRNA threonylcarbamoyladenosine biosynthesis protein TsaE [Gaiellales bacterium]
MPRVDDPGRRSWNSHELADTEALAAALAPLLHSGDTVWLRGELGAGKTAFVRAAAAALGVTGVVASPTYTVGNSYLGRDVKISHLDLYRSTGLTEEEWADLEPYFEDAIAFVEWPDAGAGLLPDPRVIVHIEFVPGDARLITLVCVDPSLLTAVAAALT